MPRTAAQVSKANDSRREQLLECAARLFVQKGYAATGVDEIGEAVGITGPALYRHFANKQALLDAVCLEGIQRLMESIQDAVHDRDASPDSMLDRLVQARVDYALAEGFTMPLHDLEARNLSEGARRQIDALEQLYVAEWMHVLAQIRPSVPASDLHTALIASHVLIGYTAARLYGREPKSLRAHLVRMALATLNA